MSIWFLIERSFPATVPWPLVQAPLSLYPLLWLEAIQRIQRFWVSKLASAHLHQEQSSFCIFSSHLRLTLAVTVKAASQTSLKCLYEVPVSCVQFSVIKWKQLSLHLYFNAGFCQIFIKHLPGSVPCKGRSWVKPKGVRCGICVMLTCHLHLTSLLQLRFEVTVKPTS